MALAQKLIEPELTIQHQHLPHLPHSHPYIRKHSAPYQLPFLQEHMDQRMQGRTQEIYILAACSQCRWTWDTVCTPPPPHAKCGTWRYSWYPKNHYFQQFT